MRITAVTVRVADERDQNSKVVAYCSFLIDDFFKVTHVRLVRRKDGSVFVAMPNVTRPGAANRRDSPTFEDADGEPFHYEDLVFPLNLEARDYLTRVIAGAYRRVVADGQTWGVVDVPAGYAKAV